MALSPKEANTKEVQYQILKTCHVFSCGIRLCLFCSFWCQVIHHMLDTGTAPAAMEGATAKAAHSVTYPSPNNNGTFSPTGTERKKATHPVSGHQYSDGILRALKKHINMSQT